MHSCRYFFPYSSDHSSVPCSSLPGKGLYEGGDELPRQIKDHLRDVLLQKEFKGDGLLTAVAQIFS